MLWLMWWPKGLVVVGLMWRAVYPEGNVHSFMRCHARRSVVVMARDIPCRGHGVAVRLVLWPAFGVGCAGRRLCIQRLQNAGHVLGASCNEHRPVRAASSAPPNTVAVLEGATLHGWRCGVCCG